MNFLPAADSRFLMYGHMDVKKLNLDLNIEMNFMPAADSRFLMYGHMDVKEIESRFEYRNEFHASSRFTIFYVWEYGWCM